MNVSIGPEMQFGRLNGFQFMHSPVKYDADCIIIQITILQFQLHNSNLRNSLASKRIKIISFTKNTNSSHFSSTVLIVV